MTLTLELPDDVLQSLQAEAEKQQVPLQEWIVAKLQSASQPSTRNEMLSGESFSALARGVVDDYRTVLERLA